MVKTTRSWIEERLGERLDPAALDGYATAKAEVAAGVPNARFAGLLSMMSRYARRAGPLAPTGEEIAEAGELLPGWNPERWTALEAARVGLVLARPDLAAPAGAAAVEEAFRFADVGELCALYKSLAHLPDGARFVQRAAEGCRTNMRSVFESVACDTPYPHEHFDDVAWNQLLVKAIFVGAPLWRVYGLDGRLSPELARMCLDLCDERRSAGRPVQPELWLALGPHGGERALAAIEQELTRSTTIGGPDTPGRQAAAIALARAGGHRRLEELAAAEEDPAVAETMRRALAGEASQWVFRVLEPELRS